MPANVTVAPVCSDLSEIVELAGAEMLSKRIFVQDFTADETVNILGLVIAKPGKEEKGGSSDKVSLFFSNPPKRP